MYSSASADMLPSAVMKRIFHMAAVLPLLISVKTNLDTSASKAVT
jgi:hypothetical protein